MTKTILVVDDERSIRSTLKNILEFEDYKVTEAEDGLQALEILRSETPLDCILCDIKMPKVDGMEVLNESLTLRRHTPVIMISGHGTIDLAVEAVKKGAFDFISKPPDLNKLLGAVRNAMIAPEKTEVVAVVSKPKKRETSKESNGFISSASKSMLQLLELANKAAATDARILILGPNGAGKELLAKGLHTHSRRNDKPLVTLNCAAIPNELIESELFGHEKGSFTNAIKQHIGKFEQADGGTLFLDEIGDMSLSAQAKVLRAMQEGIISRIGSNKDVRVDVRILAATNKNLEEEIKKGNFREDLYHRLSVVVLKMPSLNERKEDIEPLANEFLSMFGLEYNKEGIKIDKDAMKLLREKEWTGNIRQLKNAVERLVIFADDQSICKKDVESYVML